jgi:F1F0 ATPase subunit 2
MNRASLLILAFSAGFASGVVFFGGLWWTILRAVSSKRPALWFSCSLVLRATAAIAGFYFASRGDWRRLVSCLVGFLLARVCITRIARAPSPDRSRIIDPGDA